VHGEALRLLREHGKVRRLNDDRVFVSVKGKQYRYADAFDAACEAANVKNFTFHDLRHSAATYLAREGATEQQLKAIGGWKSNVVSRYVHLAAEDAKSIVEKMNNKILGTERK
jgi:integrase